MPVLAISAGHGQYIRGAAGKPRPPMLEEVDEARRVCTKVVELWKAAGVTVRGPFFDNTSYDQNINLRTIVNWHNSQSRDYDVSVHFNAHKSTSSPMGHETLYVNQTACKTLATNIASRVARAGSFINRGAKRRTDLYFLNQTAKPAVLLEVCFVDSSADADLYRRNFDAICIAIAEVIGQVTIGAPPVEPPVEPPTPPPDVEVAHIDITIKVAGEAVVTINGQDFMTVGPGPEEPSVPTFPPNQQDIICTVFGGAGDPNDSAYAPYDIITDTELSCALPGRFEGERPKVEVLNTLNHKSVVCEIRDIGPWFTDDYYWLTGNRPAAEPAGEPIKYGKHEGKTSNGAGLDLTPAAAAAIGLVGKGVVHWRFAPQELVA